MAIGHGYADPGRMVSPVIYRDDTVHTYDQFFQVLTGPGLGLPRSQLQLQRLLELPE